MSNTASKLHRLRDFFIVYFFVQLAIEILAARKVMGALAANMAGHWQRFNGISSSSILFFALIISGLIFVLGLWLFAQLQQRKNWVRILLLVIAWLTVVGAVFNLLAAPQAGAMSAWLDQWLPGLDWENLLQIDRINKVIGLFFWGYLITVLQFDGKVKEEFLPSPPSPADPKQ